MSENSSLAQTAVYVLVDKNLACDQHKGHKSYTTRVIPVVLSSNTTCTVLF